MAKWLRTSRIRIWTAKSQVYNENKLPLKKTESKTIKLEPEKNILHFGARFVSEEK